LIDQLNGINSDWWKAVDWTALGPMTLEDFLAIVLRELGQGGLQRPCVRDVRKPVVDCE
jgi:hypothetical protein